MSCFAPWRALFASAVRANNHESSSPSEHVQFVRDNAALLAQECIDNPPPTNEQAFKCSWLNFRFLFGRFRGPGLEAEVERAENNDPYSIESLSQDCTGTAVLEASEQVYDTKPEEQLDSESEEMVLPKMAEPREEYPTTLHDRGQSERKDSGAFVDDGPVETLSADQGNTAKTTSPLEVSGMCNITNTLSCTFSKSCHRPGGIGERPILKSRTEEEMVDSLQVNAFRGVTMTSSSHPHHHESCEAFASGSPGFEDQDDGMSTSEEEQVEPEANHFTPAGFEGERELVPWIPDIAEDSDKYQPIEKPRGFKSGTYDQFEQNERLFGFTSDFSDSMPCILNDVDEEYLAREAEASRLAAEIECERVYHVDDVFGTVSGGEGIDPSTWKFAGWDQKETCNRMDAAEETLRRLGVSRLAMARSLNRLPAAKLRGRRF
ncbi:hypothetical protein BJ742DRAFT_880319 [Cladochytrium replicatum]|nr:hypothetical protein BJ742DRAFT_880319 [Cladochytrium replicatum]